MFSFLIVGKEVFLWRYIPEGTLEHAKFSEYNEVFPYTMKEWYS